MKTHRVEAEGWSSFFVKFNRSHEGWAGSLEVRELGRPSRIEVDASPFRQASLETRDGRSALVLMFGEEPEEQYAYIIREPLAMLSAEREDGSEASLVIEGRDGSRCILLLVNTVDAEELAGT